MKKCIIYFNFDFWSEILITNYNKDKNKFQSYLFLCFGYNSLTVNFYSLSTGCPTKHDSMQADLNVVLIFDIICCVYLST